MYTVCTGMYRVCTKTWDWQVLWTCGCRNLDVASLAWVAWQSGRLQRGRMLPAKHRTSVGRRLVRVAKAIVTDWSEVWVWTACTCTSPVHTGMYRSVQSVAEKLRELEDILVTLDCGNWSWVCWRSIWWYPSKRILVLADYLEPYMSFNQYIPVCTLYAPVHTSMYLLQQILLRILCFYFWQWVKILCVWDRYVVVFKT